MSAAMKCDGCGAFKATKMGGNGGVQLPVKWMSVYLTARSLDPYVPNGPRQGFDVCSRKCASVCVLRVEDEE